MILRVTGRMPRREVKINGRLLSPAPSQSVYNHSPDGFAWGYGGSGPAQLALAICLTQLDREDALRCYQAFKWDHVARWCDNFSVEIDFEKWHAPWAEGARIGAAYRGEA